MSPFRLSLLNLRLLSSKSRVNARGHRLIIEQLERRELLAADLEPIKVINPLNSGSFPNGFVQFGSQMVFAAGNELGVELWKSDGTVAGTTLVKDIVAGSPNSYPSRLTVVGGMLFFVARTATTGLELWKSDGTATGTVMVKDINPGIFGSGISELCNVNGTLFFTANDGTNGAELWKSDGTPAGTVMIKDIQPGTGGSSVQQLINLAGTLIFSARDSVNGQELWRSDGTAAGTNLVASINPGLSSASPSHLTNVNGNVYFTANDGVNGVELWRTGGTAGTTALVKDIFTGPTSSSPDNLTNVNNILYFSAQDSTGNVELWKFNTTTSETDLVSDIHPSGSSNPSMLTNVAGVLYFVATEPATGSELWISEGTPASTVLLKDLLPGAGSSNLTAMVPSASGVIFSAQDAFGPAVWKSDGTSAGTVVLKHPLPGSSLPIPFMFPFAGSAFFQATDGQNGVELWKSDGTLGGTSMLKNINNSYAGSSPGLLSIVNAKMFFAAETPGMGRELWVTDGTTTGTQMVMDITPGSASSYFGSSVNVNGTLYFAAGDSTTGRELWRSDGTAAGTFRIKDIVPGIYSSAPTALVNVNGMLFFTAQDALNGRELWRSDGTSAGTLLVADIQPGSSSSYPSSLVNSNGILYFAASSSAAIGGELWRSDGTASNTVMVKDINAVGGSFPNSLTAHLGKVYFRANDGVTGAELWVSDGTPAGTNLLVDINPGASESIPTNFMAVGNQLYFSAINGTAGRELWKTDGTSIGTTLVQDIAAGLYSSSPDSLINVNGTLYFTATDPLTGTELWKSNGTSLGTMQVKDIWPGTFASQPFSLVNFGGQLAFNAQDALGQRVWTSDGTSTGTQPLISTPALSAVTGSIVNLNGQLITLFPEPLQVKRNVQVDLSSSTTDKTIVIRKVNNGLEVFDQTNSTQLAFVSSLALNYVQQLTITGSDSANETITLDYQSGGFFSLPVGITMNAGASNADSLQIIGTTAQQLSWQSLSTAQSALFTVQQPGNASPGTVDGFESITTSGFLAASINGLLQAGPPNMFFNNPGTLNLGLTTQLGGGTLSTTSLAALGSGEILSGFGSLQGRLNAELGSLILPTANMSIGSNSSATGFHSRGDLIVNQHTVSLLDSNEAVLGAQTTLGNGALPGNLSASNGLLVDFGGNVTGYGTINSPNVAGKPFTMNGSVVGTSVANPITLTGYVKGVGNLTNVSILGTYSPGFSPAAVTVGNVSYAATATTLIELGGITPGTSYDQINHIGTAALGGTLSVQFINSFVPTVGDSFTIMTATAGFTGSFASQVLPTPPLGSGWNLLAGANSLQLQLVDLANVQATQFGDGTTQRSRVDRLLVTFQGPVDIDSNAFNIFKRGVDGGLVTNSFSTSLDGSGNTVATILFSGGFTRASGALVDGYYQLTIDSSKVRRAGTLLNLDGDSDGLAGGNFIRGSSATDNFFAYYGDTSGDSQVGVAEFGQFRSSFGRLPADPGYNLLFDFDGGGVGVADFGQFRSRFGRAIVFE